MLIDGNDEMDNCELLNDETGDQKVLAFRTFGINFIIPRLWEIWEQVDLPEKKGQMDTVK